MGTCWAHHRNSNQPESSGLPHKAAFPAISTDKEVKRMQRTLSSGMSEGKTSVRLRAQRALNAMLSLPSSSFHQTHFSLRWPGLAQEGLCLKQPCKISRTFYPPTSVILESPTVILQPISSQLYSVAGLPERHVELAFQALSSPRSWRGGGPRGQGQRSCRREEMRMYS